MIRMSNYPGTSSRLSYNYSYSNSYGCTGHVAVVMATVGQGSRLV